MRHVIKIWEIVCNLCFQKQKRKCRLGIRIQPLGSTALSVLLEVVVETNLKSPSLMYPPSEKDSS